MRFLVAALLLPVGLAAVDMGPTAGQVPNQERLQSLESTGAPATSDAIGGSTWHGRVLTGLAAGVLGAGMGFFASQVVTGDWDNRQIDRAAWAAVGGSIGLALGVSFPLGGRPTVPGPPRALPERSPITAGEMSGTGVHTAHDAVELLRPQWLNQRGFQIIGEQPSDRVQVYLDDMHLGGIEKLSDVSARDLALIHFLDAAAATYRWGAGHNHGAIMMISEGDDSG